MDLWEFYEQVEKLTADLRSAGYVQYSEEVQIAISGGATSGEVLGRLSAMLPGVASRVPEFAGRTDSLAAWAKDALRAVN